MHYNHVKGHYRNKDAVSLENPSVSGPWLPHLESEGCGLDQYFPGPRKYTVITQVTGPTHSERVNVLLLSEMLSRFGLVLFQN